MDALVRTRDKVKLFGIEYNLTEHCNLRCYHCDHASPLMPKKFADLDEYGRDVRALAKAVHVEEFRVVGGDPCFTRSCSTSCASLTTPASAMP